MHPAGARWCHASLSLLRPTAGAGHHGVPRHRARRMTTTRLMKTATASGRRCRGTAAPRASIAAKPFATLETSRPNAPPQRIRGNESDAALGEERSCPRDGANLSTQPAHRSSYRALLDTRRAARDQCRKDERAAQCSATHAGSVKRRRRKIGETTPIGWMRHTVMVVARRVRGSGGNRAAGVGASRISTEGRNGPAKRAVRPSAGATTTAFERWAVMVVVCTNGRPQATATANPARRAFGQSTGDECRDDAAAFAGEKVPPYSCGRRVNVRRQLE